MKFLNLFCGVLCWSYACGIQCHRGIVFTAPGLSLGNFSAVECPPDSQFCVRAEGKVETTIGFNVDVEAIGLCANETICEDDCRSLSHLVIREFILGDVPVNQFGPDGLSSIFNITTCNSVCCNTDLCNRFTVEEITNRMEMNNAESATPSSSTTAAVAATAATANTAANANANADTTTTTTITTTTMGAESVTVHSKTIFILSFASVFITLVFN